MPIGALRWLIEVKSVLGVVSALLVVLLPVLVLLFGVVLLGTIGLMVPEDEGALCTGELSSGGWGVAVGVGWGVERGVGRWIFGGVGLLKRCCCCCCC